MAGVETTVEVDREPAAGAEARVGVAGGVVARQRQVSADVELGGVDNDDLAVGLESEVLAELVVRGRTDDGVDRTGANRGRIGSDYRSH